MKILVLGGTWFLGRAVAQTALNRGWEVSIFNRGRSGSAPEEARTVRGDRTAAADLARLAAEGPWDAVVDTSASEMAPRDVSRRVPHQAGQRLTGKSGVDGAAGAMSRRSPDRTHST